MTEPPSPFGKPFLLHPFDLLHLLVWCVGPLGTAMRVRVLHAKLYAYALPGSTARQLFNSSTLLDSSTARQNSTDLDRPQHPGTCSQPRLASTGSTATRQLLDRLDRQGLDRTSTAASTAARRSLDSSTARQPGLKPFRGGSCRSAAEAAVAQRWAPGCCGERRHGCRASTLALNQRGMGRYSFWIHTPSPFLVLLGPDFTHSLTHSITHSRARF